MGSRVRVATAACFVASGLFVGGAGGALAFADPAGGHGENRDRYANDSLGGAVRGALGRGGPDTSAVGQESGTTEGGTSRGPRQGPDTHVGAGRGGAPSSEADPKQPNGATPGDEQPVDVKPGPVDVKPGENAGGVTPGEQDPKGEPPKCEPPKCEGPDEQKPGWWPWPRPGGDPGQPQTPGGGGGGAVQPPSGRPAPPPEMQLGPGAGTAAGAMAAPGVGAAVLPALVPITLLPVIVVPAAAGGGGAAAPAAPPGPIPFGRPQAVIAEPAAGREPLPANVGGNSAAPASFRVGYGEYLRTAGMAQVAALAVPGVAGILVLTGAGGLAGYRQAKAGHTVRTGGTARFLN
jgi:hypothetical protein